LIRLDRYLYSSSHYPGDYGFIPQTLAGIIRGAPV
jgi:inorganic pyrophosphatase